MGNTVSGDDKAQNAASDVHTCDRHRAAVEVVPALAAALHDPDKDVRQHAAIALGKIGPPAGPALVDASMTPTKMSGSTPPTRFGPATAVEAVNDPDEDVRRVGFS